MIDRSLVPASSPNLLLQLVLLVPGECIAGGVCMYVVPGCLILSSCESPSVEGSPQATHLLCLKRLRALQFSQNSSSSLMVSSPRPKSHSLMQLDGLQLRLPDVLEQPESSEALHHAPTRDSESLPAILFCPWVIPPGRGVEIR